MGTWSCEDWAQVCLLSKPHPFPASAPPWSKITFRSLHRCCHSELQGGQAQRVGGHNPPRAEVWKEIRHSLHPHGAQQSPERA